MFEAISPAISERRFASFSRSAAPAFSSAFSSSSLELLEIEVLEDIVDSFCTDLRFEECSVLHGVIVVLDFVHDEAFIQALDLLAGLEQELLESLLGLVVLSGLDLLLLYSLSSSFKKLHFSSSWTLVTM